ncbi:phosphonate metabolism protein/1,5-bisphosphokinase (PRPP-forming) PhnN [Roseovarius sp. A21]|uniref:Ribose 1,5-bisphosphate phosphokinase PhnN n=1 Tax=Roseovarius bejariae TaxID=2576383 RepID=A0A844CV83_9RHOB|nr:phosphonate metabolism protein/1,5-bisphosphokinase (PRPP-forming) PhnN [Roseovarius bejariae]MRU15959.1 phosphonate metabolism protein/1,5-bisphosphokinase (PRPP-forming) PhnN [Roseovarius bejariae]
MIQRGRLIGVVGPSGVGKDTVMRALSDACPELGLVRRVITRSGGAVGEDCDVVSRAEFDTRRARGEFALHWQAHGLHYGVPGKVGRQLAGGKDLLVNLSRSVLLEAQDRFPGFLTLVLTASEEVLRERLLQRGRESRSEIAGRLERRNFAIPEGLNRVIEIRNEGCLEDTVQAARAALYPENDCRVI